jgi:hypothetical protein
MSSWMSQAIEPSAQGVDTEARSPSPMMHEAGTEMDVPPVLGEETHGCRNGTLGLERNLAG